VICILCHERNFNTSVAHEVSKKYTDVHRALACPLLQLLMLFPSYEGLFDT